MNSTLNNASPEYKKCAGKGCDRIGRTILQIRYLNKTGRMAQKVLGRCYTKRIKSKNYAVVRRELEETPGTSLRNALNEKMREGLKHGKAHNS